MEIAVSSLALKQYQSLISQSSNKTRGAESDDDSRADRPVANRPVENPGRALAILRQELQFALKMHFRARFVEDPTGYMPMREPASPDAVAGEALGAAKQVVAEAPARAASSLVTFRSKVVETASLVREQLAAPAQETDDVDLAMASLEQGLQEMEAEASLNRESSAAVLSVDTRSRQQSTIRIRTQEGDTVRLSLVNREKLSMAYVSSSDGEASSSATSIDASSSSRIRLRVQGDLNDSEMRAIQQVLIQAEAIAEDYFEGDIGAAFKLAQGFEFDTQELARVKLGFRSSERINVAYAETRQPGLTEVNAAPSGPAPAKEPAAALTEQKPAPVTDEIAVQPSETAPPEVAPQVSKDAPAFEEPALASLFDTLRGFLRSVSEGFESGPVDGSLRYHYSESFKLSLLQAVIHTLEPGESDED